MSKYQKMRRNVAYHTPDRKRPVARSTVATSHFLGIVHEAYPTATINQIYRLITNKTKYICNPEAVSVLEAHIVAGYGNAVPDWRY